MLLLQNVHMPKERDAVASPEEFSVTKSWHLKLLRTAFTPRTQENHTVYNKVVLYIVNTNESYLQAQLTS